MLFSYNLRQINKIVVFSEEKLMTGSNLGDLKVNNYGLTSASIDGADKGIYRIRNKHVDESKELYGNINSLIDVAIKNAGRNQKDAIKAGLKNRLITTIKMNKEGVFFQMGNGIKIQVKLPENTPALTKIFDVFSLSIKSLNLSLFNMDGLVNEVVEDSKFKKVFYLYSSGGGGHISAKNAIRDNRLPQLQEDVKEMLIKKHGKEKGEEYFKFYFPNYQAFVDYAKKKGLFEEKDVLVDFVGKVGKMGADSWDEAQKNGDVPRQESLAGKQYLASVLFAPAVFISALINLIRYHPDKIVSTQANNNDAIIAAIVVYNTFFKPKGSKDLKLHLYMTDMPSELSDHFFAAIKSMFQGQKDRLVLHAPKANGDFDWNIKVGLKKGQYKELSNMQLPIRPAFVQAVKKFQEVPFDPKKLQIKISSKEEREILERVVGEEAISGESSNGTQYVDYKLGENDEAHYIMLGSQPTKSALYEYLDQYVEMAHKNGNRPLHLLLFTGKFDKKESLYKEISEYLESKQSEGSLPNNLKVVPLSFQDAEQMVGFFARCHSITRSGGATCMELMVMDEVVKAIKDSGKNPDYVKPMRYVHSQLVDGRDAETSIPLWERGNFHFMRDLFRAKVVTPYTLRQIVAEAQQEQDKMKVMKTSQITKYDPKKTQLDPLMVEFITKHINP